MLLRFRKSQPFSKKKLNTAEFFRYACYLVIVLTMELPRPADFFS